MKATIKSTYPNTISLSEAGFLSLISKEWNEIECLMSDGNVIPIARHDFTCLWAKCRTYKRSRHSEVPFKVLDVSGFKIRF